MPRFNKFILLFASIFLPANAFALGTVTVMADSSMNIAMVELARDYSRANDVAVNNSFAASSTQQLQISEGSAADILITPKAEWIEQLKTQGVVDVYSVTVVARNQLALVGPIDSPLQTRSSDGFPTTELIRQFGWEPSFVVASPDSLLEGSYSKEALRNIGAAGDLEEYTLYIKQLNQMFEMVTNQNMYGIFFYSSTIGKSGIRVLELLPENSHKPIEYVAVAIASDNMEEARKFLKYLKSDNAKAILQDNGFLTN